MAMMRTLDIGPAFGKARPQDARACMNRERRGRPGTVRERKRGAVAPRRHGSAVGGSCRSGEADVQDEVSDPQVELSASGPVHDERQQDDGQNDNDHPEEEDDNAGNGVTGNGCCSSHSRQLPAIAPLILRRALARSGRLAVSCDCGLQISEPV